MHKRGGYHLSRFVDSLNVKNLASVGVLTKLLQFEGNVCSQRTYIIVYEQMYELWVGTIALRSIR